MYEHLRPDEQALAEYMSRLSEDGFRARWMGNIEYLLWSAVTGNTAGMRWKLRDEDVDQLRELSERCGGWIVHDEEARFAPLPEWEKLYTEHQAKRTRKIEGRLYSNEEFRAELETRRKRLLELRQQSQVAHQELDAAVVEFFDALVPPELK
jgi:hypothetical protein